MKKRRYLNYKENKYMMLNCLEKINVSIITDTLNIDNIENIDQEKD